MPKKFAIILSVIQLILSFLHFLLYLSLLTLFPALAAHHLGLLITFLLLSVIFLAFSIACHFFNNTFLAFGYYLSGAWLILAGYSLMTLALGLVVYAFFDIAPQILGTLALSASVLITLYGLINARLIRITQLNIKLPNLSQGWRQRTIVMVSDLHLGQVLNTGYAKRVAKKINKLKPDLVLIPGDFYDGVHTNFQDLANEFTPGKKIHAEHGVYFSSGNHEMFAGYQICEQAIRNAGIQILENQKVEIDGLQIIGLSYLGDLETLDGESDENVKSRLLRAGLDKNKPSILLKHVPNHLEAVAEAGVNLQLSGHSHQGQIWPGRHITKKVWKGFDYGFKTLKTLQLYTSSGVGTWGPSLRVFTKSEIVKINFI